MSETSGQPCEHDSYFTVTVTVGNSLPLVQSIVRPRYDERKRWRRYPAFSELQRRVLISMVVSGPHITRTMSFGLAKPSPSSAIFRRGRELATD